jgi:NADH/F420H2 dehydrogenase subunit C
MMLCVSGVDYFDHEFDFRSSEDRFEVVYHLLKVPSNETDSAARLRVRVGVPESDPSIDSVSALWAGANFMEREIWDMYGITFNGHPDMRRILMYDEFVGHPLRKDYPIQAKQPRIPLLSPEVENTARLMQRPSLSESNLVQIRGRAN